MKIILRSVFGVVVLFAFIHNSFGLGISDFEKIKKGMTYHEVISIFGETGEFEYLTDTKTNKIIGDVVMKWGGSIVAGPGGKNRVQLGYIIIRFTDIRDNDPKTGKVAAINCCGLSNDPRCTCEEGNEEIYKNQFKIGDKEISTKRVKFRPGD